MAGEYNGSQMQAEQPQLDPRLSMSAPELLASLRNDGNMNDNELFVNLANGNGKAAAEINYLLDAGHNPTDIAQQLGLNISMAQPPEQDIQVADYELPEQADEPQGFGTFEAITAELPKLQAQGLNPYQVIYSLAQRQDEVGESIRTAYKQGMGAEQLTNYFKVNDIWTPKPPSSYALNKADELVNLTTPSLPS